MFVRSLCLRPELLSWPRSRTGSRRCSSQDLPSCSHQGTWGRGKSYSNCQLNLYVIWFFFFFRFLIYDNATNKPNNRPEQLPQQPPHRPLLWPAICPDLNLKVALLRPSHYPRPQALESTIFVVCACLGCHSSRVGDRTTTASRSRKRLAGSRYNSIEHFNWQMSSYIRSQSSNTVALLLICLINEYKKPVMMIEEKTVKNWPYKQNLLWFTQRRHHPHIFWVSFLSILKCFLILITNYNLLYDESEGNHGN